MSNNKVSHKLSKYDYRLICMWLEDPINRNKLDGVEKKTKLGCRPPMKAKAYEQLAKFVNDNQRKGSTLVSLTGSSMRTRWRHYFNRYRASKVESERPGFGLTDTDRADGIETVEAKLEHMCPCFSRMDAIFGDKQVAFASYQTAGAEIAGELPWNDVGNEDGDTGGKVDADRAEISPEYEDDPVDDVVELPSRSTVPRLLAAAPSPAPSQDVPTPSPNAADVPIIARETTPSPHVSDTSLPLRPKRKIGPYPNKKDVSETWHSVNASFAHTLEATNCLKEKANELRASKLEWDQQVEEKKLAWEKERFQEESQRYQVEREDRLEAAIAARQERKEAAENAVLEKRESEKNQLKLAALTSSRPIEEVKELLNLLS